MPKVSIVYDDVAEINEISTPKALHALIQKVRERGVFNDDTGFCCIEKLCCYIEELCQLEKDNNNTEDEGENIQLAYECYEDLFKIDSPNTDIYNRILTIVGEYGQMHFLREVYQAAMCSGEANAETYIVVIKVASKHGDLELAKMAFKNAVETEKNNLETYAVMIEAAGEYGSSDDIAFAYYEVYKAAIASSKEYIGEIKTIIYNNMIIAAGRKKNCMLHWAVEVYKAATKKKEANAVTCASILIAADNSKNLEYAKTVFYQYIPIEIKNNDEDYQCILHVYLDIFYRSDESEARHVYKDNKGLLTKCALLSSNKINLQGFLYGSSRLLLEDVLASKLKENSDYKFEIIHGKGLHSKYEEPVTKLAVRDVFKNICTKYQDSNTMMFRLEEEDKHNPSVTFIHVIHRLTEKELKELEKAKKIEFNKRKALGQSIESNKKRRDIPILFPNKVTININCANPCSESTSKSHTRV